MTVVKICGVTRPDDARMVAEAGTEWIGINFWPSSKRYVDASQGAAVAAAARAINSDIVVVGVFVNQSAEDIGQVSAVVNLDYAQLHGDETAEHCAAVSVPVIKALAMSSSDDVGDIGAYPCETYLIDTPTAGYGGSGRTFDWSLGQAAVATGKRIVLAGGLNPDNVAEAIAQVAPFAVDVASGVESAPGVKDAALVRAFVQHAKQNKSGDAKGTTR